MRPAFAILNTVFGLMFSIPANCFAVCIKPAYDIPKSATSNERTVQGVVKSEFVDAMDAQASLLRFRPRSQNDGSERSGEECTP
jgi:hypothetical protein